MLSAQRNYRAAHESEIILHEAAAKALREVQIGSKLPSAIL